MKISSWILGGLALLILWLLFGKRFSTALATVTAPPTPAPTPQGSGVSGALQQTQGILDTVKGWFPTSSSSTPPPPADAAYL